MHTWVCTLGCPTLLLSRLRTPTFAAAWATEVVALIVSNCHVTNRSLIDLEDASTEFCSLLCPSDEMQPIPAMPNGAVPTMLLSLPLSSSFSSSPRSPSACPRGPAASAPPAACNNAVGHGARHATDHVGHWARRAADHVTHGARHADVHDCPTAFERFSPYNASFRSPDS